jgi:hypothetical protein
MNYSKDFIVQFHNKVKKGNPDECWIWQGRLNPAGYGMVLGYTRAHRVAYELHYGEFDYKLEILHKCDNPSCCNPAHLRAGTHGDNMADMSAKGRCNSYNSKKTECKHGHLFTQKSTGYQKGKRYCKICDKIKWQRRYYGSQGNTALLPV